MNGQRKGWPGDTNRTSPKLEGPQARICPAAFIVHGCPGSLPQVKDVKTGDCYRADHLLEGALEGALEDTKNPLSKEAAYVS